MEPFENKLNSVQNILTQRAQAARTAEQRKNELVMYLAHDIRTPLTSIIGYLNLLEEIPDLPAVQKGKLHSHLPGKSIPSGKDDRRGF